MGLVKWVAQLSCGHTTGGECAEDYLPTEGEVRDVCATCWSEGPAPEVTITGVVDSRPQRVG